MYAHRFIFFTLCVYVLLICLFAVMYNRQQMYTVYVCMHVCILYVYTPVAVRAHAETRLLLWGCTPNVQRLFCFGTLYWHTGGGLQALFTDNHNSGRTGGLSALIKDGPMGVCSRELGLRKLGAGGFGFGG